VVPAVVPGAVVVGRSACLALKGRSAPGVELCVGGCLVARGPLPVTRSPELASQLGRPGYFTGAACKK
jgi:hypothetical protein